MGHSRQGLVFCGYYRDKMGIVSGHHFCWRCDAKSSAIARKLQKHIELVLNTTWKRDCLQVLGVFQSCCTIAVLTFLQPSCLKTYLPQCQVRCDLRPQLWLLNFIILHPSQPVAVEVLTQLSNA